MDLYIYIFICSYVKFRYSLQKIREGRICHAFFFQIASRSKFLVLYLIWNSREIWYVKFFCLTYHFLDWRHNDDISMIVLLTWLFLCIGYWLDWFPKFIIGPVLYWGYLSFAMPVNKQFVPVIPDTVPQEFHLSRWVWEREMMCLEWCTWELFDISNSMQYLTCSTNR